jgi:ceramide glucosyltransferase
VTAATILLAALAIADRLWKWWYADRFLRTWRPAGEVREDATVSVLVPVLSGDPTMESVIARSVRAVARSGVSFTWMVDAYDTEGLAVCARAETLARSLGARARVLVTPPPPDGVNPKSFKLRVAATETDGEFVCVLDDDTVLPAGALDRTVAALGAPGAGLAFGLPYYETWSTGWSRLVSSFVNGHSLTTYLPPLAIMPPITVNGMYYVIPRRVLDACGGFLPMERELSDDYAIGRLIARHGYALVQTDVRHAESTEVRSARHYAKLMKRWLRAPQISIEREATRRERALYYALAAAPACYPLAVLVLAVLAATSASLGALAALGLVLLASSVHLNRRWLHGATPSYGHLFVLAMHFVLPLHLVLTLVRRDRLAWRGNVIEVGPGGTFRYAARAGDRAGDAELAVRKTP